MLLLGWWLSRSRLGFALRLIGEDEQAARHCGIDATRTKLLVFTITSVFMVLAGAIVAPRWTYIDPAISFNAVISFQVVIMALLGGAGSLFGPVAGAIPMTLLFEFLSAKFPNYFSVLLGVSFMVIVYFVPDGVAAAVARRAAVPSARFDTEGGDEVTSSPQDFESSLWKTAEAAARTVFLSSMAIVIGPTPPGTGVMNDATCAALSKCTSPANRYPRAADGSATREIPTSMTTAPGRIMSPVIDSGRPSAAMTMSARRVCAARSRVREWHTVTVQSPPAPCCMRRPWTVRPPARAATSPCPACRPPSASRSRH